MSTAAPVLAAVPKGEAARVLIVDDLEVNRDLLARRVQRLGHTVAFAASGREALVQLRAAPFDLVLLDITMPDMDGYEALAQIKADPVLAMVPVVMVTAIDGVDSVVRCLELGADDYITKPFNPLVLKARVESSLSKKRVADLNARLLSALSREMAIAQKIQLGFLPEALPQVPGWALAAVCVPARQVGGDFFDALLLADGRLAFTVADVCDKGVGAALYMALIRSLLRISLQQAPAGEAAPELLARAVAFSNDYVATVHARDNMFATVFTAILAPATGELVYINAGHDAPLLLRQGAAQPELLPAEGLALGMMPGQAHRARHTRLAAGDRLLVFTDGLPEALSPEHTALGVEAVASTLLGCGGEAPQAPAAAMAPMAPMAPGAPGAPGAPDTASALLAALQQQLAAHVRGREPHDDVTLLCLAPGL